MFAFWYLLLFILAYGYGWPRLPYALYKSAAWCLVGAISGIGFYLIFSAHKRAHIAISMKPTCLRGLVAAKAHRKRVSHHVHQINKLVIHRASWQDWEDPLPTNRANIQIQPG